VRYSACLLVMVAALAISIALTAQEVYQSDTAGFARFSYIGSPVARGRIPENVCFAASSDGEYRIVRVGIGGLQGKMSGDDLKKFKSLIESENFRSLTGDHSGLIRQESENFIAEIPWSAWKQHGQTQRFQWLNADGEAPFPMSAAKVIEWIRNFDPKGAKPFDAADFPDVCPFRGLRYVQPSVAQR
jgi:hypothetical protein